MLYYKTFYRNGASSGGGESLYLIGKMVLGREKDIRCLELWEKYQNFLIISIFFNFSHPYLSLGCVIYIDADASCRKAVGEKTADRCF